MNQPLFRKESVAYQRSSRLGKALEAKSVSFAWLTAVAVLIALAIIIFLWLGEYTRKSHVEGYLAPDKGLIKVYALQAGVLIERHVEEGQYVKKGDPLFILSTERSSIETKDSQTIVIDQLKQRRHSLREELLNQKSIDSIKTNSINTRLKALNRELTVLNQQIITQEKRVLSANKMAKRYQNLLKSNFVPEIKLQEKEELLLEQQAQLQTLNRTQLSLRRTISTLKSELVSTQLETKNRYSAIERDIILLNQSIEDRQAQRSIIITAPESGIVSTILGETGQTATTSKALLSILPTGAKLEANLLVPSRSIGFIKKGQVVTLRYQAYPYQRFGSYRGHIKEITKTLITPGDAVLPIQFEESIYRVTVSLLSQNAIVYQKETPLQSGMLVDADIWLDHRRIIEWIFDPLFSITGRV